MLHIEQCLIEFEQARHLVEHPNEVEMAIWYHDAIYDPESEQNEEKSAQLAQKVAKEIGLPDIFGRRVHDLVLVTKHEKIPEGIDAKVLVDIDLSIFGRSEEEFDKYERNIRKEYQWCSDEEFKAGRADILQKFLNRQTRPAVYLTDFFREKYETQARKNLERSLAKLKSS
jgi:predicted metal-dependent HD superfamily phosphohydrolase